MEGQAFEIEMVTGKMVKVFCRYGKRWNDLTYIFKVKKTRNCHLFCSKWRLLVCILWVALLSGSYAFITFCRFFGLCLHFSWVPDASYWIFRCQLFHRCQSFNYWHLLLVESTGTDQKSYQGRPVAPWYYWMWLQSNCRRCQWTQVRIQTMFCAFHKPDAVIWGSQK